MKSHWFEFQEALSKSELITSPQDNLISEILRGPNAPSHVQLSQIDSDAIRCLVRQAWHLLNYQWQQVIDLDKTWMQTNHEKIPEKVLIEQEFITLVANSTANKNSLEIQYHSQLSHRVAQHQQNHVALGFIVEKAAENMSVGLYEQALKNLQNAKGMLKSQCVKSQYWILRHEIIAGICNEAVGKYAESALHLQNQRQILENCPQPVLWLAYIRRQLSHYIESEQLALADQVRESVGNSINNTQNPTLKAMYLYECLRLHLELGRHQEAEQCIEAQERAVHEGKIPKSFILLSHERCELALLKYPPDQAAQIILKELWWIQKNASPSAQAMALFTLAKAHGLAGSFEAAFQNAELALTLCQKYNFGRISIRVAFFLIAMSQKLKNYKQVSHYLRYAELALQNISLPLHQDLLLALRWQFAANHIIWHQEQGRFFNPREHEVLQIWSHQYLLKDTCLSFLEHVSGLTSGMAGYAPQNNVLVFWKKENGIQCIDMTPSTLAKKLVSFLLKRLHHGASAKDIHCQFWPNSNYNPIRHGARTHSLIKAARGLFKSTPLKIEYAQGKYRIEPRESIFTMQPPKKQDLITRARKRRALPKYREAILNLLKSEGMSGIEISRHLKITAQSAHPVLKELEKSGTIRFTKCGRYSKYYLEKKQS